MVGVNGLGVVNTTSKYRSMESYVVEFLQRFKQDDPNYQEEYEDEHKRCWPRDVSIWSLWAARPFSFHLDGRILFATEKHPLLKRALWEPPFS